MLKPFKQIPQFSDDEKIEITGAELRAIEKFSEAFTKFLPMFESILIRNINDKKIIFKYEDLDGNEIPLEEIVKMYHEAFQNASPNTEPDILN